MKPNWGAPPSEEPGGRWKHHRGSRTEAQQKAVDTPPNQLPVGAPALYPSRGKNLRPRNGDGRAELDREFAAKEAPIPGHFRSAKWLTPIR